MRANTFSVENLLQEPETVVHDPKLRTQQVKISSLCVVDSKTDFKTFLSLLESLAAQDTNDWELIIVANGGLPYNFTAETITNRFNNDVVVISIPERIPLPQIAYYKAVQYARGQLLYFAIPGFPLLPSAFSTLSSHIETTSAGATWGSVVNSGGEIIFGNPETHIDTLFYRCFIHPSAAIIRKEVFDEIGFFDPSPLLSECYWWDACLRIIEEYNFNCCGKELTTREAIFAFEKYTNDQDYLWALWEHFRLNRNVCLSLEKYPFHLLMETFGKRSKNYYLQLQRRLALSEIEGLDVSTLPGFPGRDVRRVYISCPGVESSVSLAFNPIFRSGEAIIRYEYILNPNLSAIASCNVYIIARHLELSRRQAKITNVLAIPLYYYIDDEMVSHGKAVQNSTFCNDIAALTSKEYLQRFTGIIVTTQALKSSFDSLHNNVIILEQSIPEQDYFFHEEEDRLGIAFFGGKFRDEPMAKYVLPALVELSKEKPITLVYPEDSREQFVPFACESLCLKEIPRISFLDSALAAYKTQGIDFQIHPSANLEFSLYKTKNALLNSTRLGSILLSSNCSPFKKDDPNADAFVSIDNTAAEWKNVLAELIRDESKRRRIFLNALRLCKERFTPEQTEQALLGEINRPHLLKKTALLSSSKEALCPVDIGLGYDSELFRFWPLAGTRTYEVVCAKEEVSGFALVLNSIASPKGALILEAKSSEKTVAVGSLNLEEVWPNSWNFIDLDKPLIGYKGERLSLSFWTEPSSTPFIEYAENQDKRSVAIKLLNKVGLHPQVPGLLAQSQY